MAGPFPTEVGRFGTSLRVSADGKPEMKVGGCTIDWPSVTAAGAQIDGVRVEAGEKYIRYGTIMTKIKNKEVQTVDVAGGTTPTGGTFVLTLGNFSTTALAYNASAATVQAALEVLLGAGRVTVTKATTVFTITYDEDLGDVPLIVATNSMTPGGTAITVAVGTAGSDSNGKYGPYTSGASNGLQTLTRGECFIIDTSVKEEWINSDWKGGFFDGGLVWQARLLLDVGTAPTTSNFLAAFPRIRFIANE
jgi:hypothetical protein